MRKLLTHLLSPTGLLYIFVAIAQFAHAVYMSTGAWEPNPTFTFIYAMGFLWIIGWWLLTDSRKRGINWVYDMGLFLYIAWPILMPYYLIKDSRSQRLVGDPWISRSLHWGVGVGFCVLLCCFQVAWLKG